MYCSNIFPCVPLSRRLVLIEVHFFRTTRDLSFGNIQFFLAFSLNSIFFAMFLQLSSHTSRVRTHTYDILFNGSVESWSNDLWCANVILSPRLSLSVRPSVCLRSACVFIIYFAFWQKDFKTIILMFFPHTHTYIYIYIYIQASRYRETDITSNWVGFIGKMLKCRNDFCQFLAFKCNFSLHLTLALSHIIRAKSKTLFNQTQTQMQIQQKCNVNKYKKQAAFDSCCLFLHPLAVLYFAKLSTVM